jgi:AcrR family transcriptional regulator
MSPDEKTENPTGPPETVPVSRHSLRAEQTRLALLTAAEKIFARDGFEAARIEEIAAEAGRTRGAFYANFENKTDVFLALRNRMIRRRAQELKERITGLPSDETRRNAILCYVMEAFIEPRAMLLQIEFKLYALRHPERLAEFAKLHVEASVAINREVLPELFTEQPPAAEVMSRDTIAIESVLEGFALNALFTPGLLTRAYLERVLPPFLAGILSDKRAGEVPADRGQ